MQNYVFARYLSLTLTCFGVFDVSTNLFCLFFLTKVHLQNGHSTTGARRGNSAELVQPDDQKGGRLSMKETFDVEENSKNKVPLRERLAQRNKQKTENQSSSSTDSPSSSTSALPKISTDDLLAAESSIGDRRPSESGGENRRMRLRMMYGSSVDKNDQELADDMNKMNLSQSIADRKAASENEKIAEKDEKPLPPAQPKEDLSSKLTGNIKEQKDKIKKEKENKDTEKKEEKTGFLSKVKNAIGGGSSSKPSDPPAPPKQENKNQRSQEDIELEARVLRNRPLVINEYDFKDLTEDDDYETLIPPTKAPVGRSMVDGVPPPPPAPPGFGPPPPPPAPPGFGPPPPPPGMPPPPPPPGGMPPPPPPPGMGGGLAKTSNNRKFVRLFWQEVKQTGLPQPFDKTIWNEVKPIDVDTKKLEHLFESRTKQTMKRAESVDKLAKKEIAVLDLKRAQAINIVLTKLPPIRVIKQAILDMDAAVVDREGVEVRRATLLLLNLYFPLYKLLYREILPFHRLFATLWVFT